MPENLDLLERIWNWLSSIEKWNSFEGWCARLAFLAIVVWLLFLAIKQIVELLAAIADGWQKLGLRIGVSKEEKAAIRRKRQFCKVLQGDVASLEKAENWNDQWFTDLEAEVEVEGRYYTRRWNRLFRRADDCGGPRSLDHSTQNLSFCFLEGARVVFVCPLVCVSIHLGKREPRTSGPSPSLSV